MDKEGLTRQLGDGLKELLTVKSREQQEIRLFHEVFSELYENKICDSYMYLKQHGINHYLFYDDKRCLIIQPLEDCGKSMEEPEISFKLSRFPYHSAASLRFGLESAYRREKGDFLGFRRAFVLEEYGDLKRFVPRAIDYAVLLPGFTRMKLSEPIRVAIMDEDREVNTLDGRILDISEAPDRNKRPC